MSIQFRVFRDEEPGQPREGDVLVKEGAVLYYKTGKWHSWILPPGANPSEALAIHAIWLNWRAEEARISYASAWSFSDAADKQGYLRALKEAQMMLKMAIDLAPFDKAFTFDPKLLGHVQEILQDGTMLVETKLTTIIEVLGEDRFFYLLKRGLKARGEECRRND